MPKEVKTQSERKRTKRRVQSKPGVRPRRRRKSRKGLYFLLLGAVVIGVMLILCNTVFFDLRGVSVEGDSIYGESEIRSAAGLVDGQNIWGLNTKKTAEKIYDALPEAESVTVRKKYPNDLVVTVTRPKITAAVSEGALYALISGQGRLLRREAEVPSGVVEYVGLGAPVFTASGFLSGSAIQLDQLNNIYEQVTASGVPDIVRIEIGSSTQNYLYYADRLKIKLGTTEKLSDKLAFLARFIAQDLLEDEHGMVDLTDPKKLIFNPEDEQEQQTVTDAAITTGSAVGKPVVP